MLMQGQVGPLASNTSLGAGQQPPARLGNMGELIKSDLHGRYYEGSYRKARFGGSMQAVLATATIAGLSTTVTGTVVLANPPGSGINAAIEKVGIGFVLAPAAPLVYGIATGASATAVSGTLTSLTPKAKLIGSGALPLCGLYSSASIVLPVAPTVDQVLGFLDTGAITTQTNLQTLYDLEGSIVLAPGSYALIWTSAVLLASAMIASFQWEEVPI
jgi:hypothetical protein